MLGLALSFYDENNDFVQMIVLSVLECTDNRGEGILKLINAEFMKLNLKWKNCIAFSCENAKVMLGQLKCVAKSVVKEQPNLKIIF